MELHKNARSCPASRILLVQRILGAMPVTSAADAAKRRVAVLEFKNKTEGYAWAWYRAGRRPRTCSSPSL
jgi:hypothetical protein